MTECKTEQASLKIQPCIEWKMLKAFKERLFNPNKMISINFEVIKVNKKQTPGLAAFYDVLLLKLLNRVVGV